MTKALTREERILLQQYYDGDELADDQVADVQELLNDSSAARVFMTALEELTMAATAADEAIWERADAPSASNVVHAALEAASMADAPLADLVGLLERFWDGEVVPEEIAAVEALLEERDDVADYLANLEGIRAGVVASSEDAVESVSFDGFWDALESRIDAEETAFDPDEHRVLLYRYHDGEATDAERAQVEAWLQAPDEDVVNTLAALEEVRFATGVAVELAVERAELDSIWPVVEDAIDDEIEAQGENVVSLERQKRERKKGFLADYRQGVFAAVATILIVAIGAGIFQEQLFGPSEKVIVEKTVVIVDSVEYQPGSSVMVNSPMKPAAATVDSPEEADGAAEEEPTVIWLLDTSEESAPATEGDETDAGDGAEEVDTTEEISDQPI